MAGCFVSNGFGRRESGREAAREDERWKSWRCSRSTESAALQYPAPRVAIGGVSGCDPGPQS